jgi:lactate permease
MWAQQYQPLANNLALSAAAAAIPLFVIGLALGVWRVASWKASLLALGAGAAVAWLVYGMPAPLVLAAGTYGAAFGLFPLGYLVFAAILLFDIAVLTGRFENIRRSVVAISPDGRVQALIIAFAFGAFLEGASGSGTPVAVTASILAGIGFSPFMAAGLSLLSNTAPVAFGALGLPIVTLGAVTGLPVQTLSAAAGRICPIVALIVPAYLVVVLAGGRQALGVWPAIVVAGVTFGAGQFLVSNFIGPYLADILSAIVTLAALIVCVRMWQPAGVFRPVPAPEVVMAGAAPVGSALVADGPPLRGRDIVDAWLPYLLLVGTVVLWGAGPVQRLLDQATIAIRVPVLHNAVVRIPPIVPTTSPYPAVFTLNWLGAAGTACLIAALLTALVSGMRVRDVLRAISSTARRLALAELTIACVLGLAYLMNYAGATASLGLAAAATGSLLPLFGAYLGWLGTFLTGSDTSTNALFGPLQVVSAERVGINPVLMCAVNTCGGVTGKMISVQNIAVAAAATAMGAREEANLFRFTLKHSVVLASVVGIIALIYAYVIPTWIPR